MPGPALGSNVSYTGAGQLGGQIPGNAGDYGAGYSSLQQPLGIPSGLLNGLGPAQLNTSQYQLQTFDPTDVGSPGLKLPTSLTGQGSTLYGYTPGQISEQNANVAGYDATQAANAQNEGYLQQAAIAQSQLLGNLNSRGLLNSYEQGGAGTTDMQQLQNSLDNAANTQGQSLQNELSGLTTSDAMYQLALQNYQNQAGQFGQTQQNNQPGISDFLGLGLSALPLIPGI